MTEATVCWCPHCDEEEEGREPAGHRTEIKNVVFDTQVEMSGRQFGCRKGCSELGLGAVLGTRAARPTSLPCACPHQLLAMLWPRGAQRAWGWKCEVRAFVPQLPPAGSAGGGSSLKGKWKVLAPVRHLSTLLVHSAGPMTAPVPASANPGVCRVISPLPRGSASPALTTHCQTCLNRSCQHQGRTWRERQRTRGRSAGASR